MADLPPGPPTPMAQWREFTDLHLPGLLVNDLAHAMATAATRALTLQQEEIARLRAELDRYQGRTVYHSTHAQLDAAQASLTVPELHVGDILRATDTGYELEWRGPDSGWFSRA